MHPRRLWVSLYAPLTHQWPSLSAATQAHNSKLKETAAALDSELAEKTGTILKYEAEIKRRTDEIEKKTKEVDRYTPSPSYGRRPRCFHNCL